MRTLRKLTPINAGSMADIAFLLLIFFFVTTTIQTDKGITLLLPPYVEDPPAVKIPERNLFKILINSQNAILVENELLTELSELKKRAKEFILNPSGLDELPADPQDAIISLKTSRGSSYITYIEVLDELKGAYYEIYASRVQISAERFRSLDLKNPDDRRLYVKAREGIPMNISLAENPLP